MSKKKLYILLIGCSLLIAAFAERGVLVSHFFEWYLKGYCRSHLDSRLSYNTLYHEKGEWIFDHPVLTTKNRLEHGGFRCQAERASLSLSFDWSSLSMTANVAVQSPQIDVGAKGKEIKKIIHSLEHSTSFLTIYTSLTSERGTILIHDFSQEVLTPAPLFFSIDLNWMKKKEGTLSLWMGDASQPGHDLLAILSEPSPDLRQLTVDLCHVDLPALQHMVHALWPETSSLQMEQGSVEGNMTLFFPTDSKTYAEGHVALHTCALHDTTFDTDLNVPDLTVDLFPQQILDQGVVTTHTLGHVEIPASSQLTFLKQGYPLWLMSDIGVALSFESEETTRFTLSAKVASTKQERQLYVEGVGSPMEWGQKSFFLDVELTGEDKQSDVAFHFSRRYLDEEQSLGEIEITGFGEEEFAFLQNLLGHRYPEWYSLKIVKGVLDASAIVYFKGSSLAEVNIENLAAHHLIVTYDPWSLTMGTEALFGSLSFNLFSSDPLKTLNMNLNIEQGSSINQKILSGIKTNLAVRHGIVQKSVIQGEFVGLKGEIILDGTSPEPLAKVSLKGTVDQGIQLLPESFKKGLSKLFHQDHIGVTANIEQHPTGFLCTGRLNISPQSDLIEQKEEEMIFGFSLERASQGLWKKWSPHAILSEYNSEIHEGLLPSIVPALEASMLVIYKHLIKNEIRFGDIIVKNGWFTAKEFPIEKYISPFIFRNGQIQASGLGDFHGTFDHRQLTINYDTKDLVLENEDFSIEIPFVALANYTLDFDTGEGRNTFPIRDGTYFEKNSGLLFTDVNGVMQQTNEQAHFDTLTGFCNGLYFKGTTDIDWSMPGDGIFAIDIKAEEMHGKVSQLQHLLSHIDNEFFFLKIPLEGDVLLQQEPSLLSFYFYPGGYDLQIQIHGAIHEGRIPNSTIDLSLQDFNVLFDYDHQLDLLTLSEIQGALLVGRSRHIEEYPFSAAPIVFSNNPLHTLEFDLQVADLLRLKGKTVTSHDTVEFLFDRTLSHFGGIHPQEIGLSLRNWSRVESFQFAFAFDLNTFLPTLQTFSRSGLFFLSRSWLKEFNEITAASGHFDLQLGYDPLQAAINYQLQGSQISLNSNQINTFFLAGKKKDQLWSVDQLQIDDTSAAFDLIKEGALWNINFLGVRIGQALLLGMEGQYRSDDSHLETKINLFEADIEELCRWPSVQRYLSNQLESVADPSLIAGAEYHLPQLTNKSAHAASGKIRATGTLHADFNTLSPGALHANLHMKGSLKEGVIAGVPLQDLDDLSLHYNSDSNSITIALGEGIYNLLGWSHKVKHLEFYWDAHGIAVQSDYDYKNTLLHIKMGATAPHFNAGECVISEKNNQDEMPLIVHWKIENNSELIIDRVSGTLCGIQCDLIRENNISPSLLSLTGSLRINMRKASSFFDKKMKEGIDSLDFGEGYTLSGTWMIDKRSPLNNLTFQGDLRGRDFEFLGYQFYDLSAQVMYDGSRLSLNDLVITDHGGNVQVNEALFFKQSTDWIAVIPKLEITELRPAFLRPVLPSSSTVPRSLNIRHLIVNHLQGVLGDRSSFEGAGELSFINPPKKNLQQTIFAIPAELLTKIGLDLDVLTPVRGTVLYKISKGKALVTKFKEMYSKGKASKFYLPNNNYESYVDFDGNLHLQVRMKQYNLLFKLAELFTVTVQGTFSNPTYSLQKQEKRQERSLIDIVQRK